ncbi:hypothetical protein [Streptomyces caeruleatus]|uniref:Uncharacterized protein n=1 Tax=Streptomyces caeruleatus TaxID=661399 RepID=A0A101TGN4_9ACTN|nr:hypothetical protein [Streptomyces caeruleatus]KUN92028.1 hypothetical protein AQJ67_41270 [Streptomyces caeruleatus]
MTVWLSGMVMTADRLNDYSLDDETTSGFVIASGWTLNNFWANRQGATVEMNIYVQRTGGDITTTNGGFADVTVGTAPSAWRPNSASTISGSFDNGVTGFGGCVIGTDGIVTIRNSIFTVTNTSNLRFHFTFNREP